MRWLIVEDALRDRCGHWLAWVTTFQRGFRELGDEVVVLADAQMEPDIRDALDAQPILPPSIWHRMGDGAGALTRYSRVLTHNWQTWRVLRRYLRESQPFDAVFVPTVSVHHLLAWSRLIKRTLRNQPTRVLLFFLTAPIRKTFSASATSDGSPTAQLFVRLIKGLEPEVRSGKVVLGVETEAMRDGLNAVTGVPFVFFPQPVPSLDACNSKAARNGAGLRMACYGAARAEKGSDVLQEAILIHRRQFPRSSAEFTIQWINDFSVHGAPVCKSPELLADPQVRFLTRYFDEGEYPEHLGRTDVMLLPYRFDSYGLRGSRVAIEAVTNGIPVIATDGTTLARLVRDHGAGLWCEDGNARSLAAAIGAMESRFEELDRLAVTRRLAAQQFFSVAEFRSLFCAPGATAMTLAFAGSDRTLSFQQT